MSFGRVLRQIRCAYIAVDDGELVAASTGVGKVSKVIIQRRYLLLKVSVPTPSGHEMGENHLSIKTSRKMTELLKVGTESEPRWKRS